MLEKPTSSIPERFDLKKDVKGCYRVLNNKTIHHKMLQSQHYQNVLKEASSSSDRVLFIQDGSELIYNGLKRTDLGPTADAGGNGILFHSCLAVKLVNNQPSVLGLAGQKAWIRETPSNTTKSKDNQEKESRVWEEMIRNLGSVPEGCRWTTVGDRGADIFSFIESLPAGWDCVIRSKHDRQIKVNGETKKLKGFLRDLPCKGSTLHFQRARKSFSREITLKITWDDVEMLPPTALKGKQSVAGTYIRVWSDDADIEWILFTKSRLCALEDALEIVNIYRHRWLIEEYHKCLKTGCRIEEVQLKTGDRIMTLFGLLGVIATQLLQLKNISRIDPDEPAEKHVDKLSIEVLQHIYKLTSPLTVREFWRRVAMLVGFMGRKSDGDPGWQKLWKGWIALRDLCRGVEIGRELSEKKS